MTAEIGLFFLIIALGTSLLQSCFLLPASPIRNPLSYCLPYAAWLQALCITLALTTLIVLRLDSDFSVVNVIKHSNLTLPTLYKIVGAWGNHEGSMLLWAWVLAIFGALLAITNKSNNESYQTTITHLAIAVQAMVAAGVLLFILFTSNPFERYFPPTIDGEALNPLLQDIALSFHPPFLYLGYVGFSIVFSLAVAGLLHGRLERNWAAMAHPWILASWSFLTIGIGLGSWWAYRVLGWGGFWFWDPVENASLLPWLSGTALLHSNIVFKKRGQLAQWVMLLAIITFGLSLLGTFLVRSGVLTSVHSFASDPMRGFFILMYIVAIIGSALLLFALRGPALQAHQNLDSQETILPMSREGLIIINNLFLLTACATLLLGTTYPMLAEWLIGQKLTVGPPYFNATCLPLMAAPLVFAGLAPFFPWKKANLSQALRQAQPALLACLAALLLTLALVKSHLILSLLGSGLAAWLGISSFLWLTNKQGRKGKLSACLAHFGTAILILGVTGATLWKEEKEQWLTKGDHLKIAGYELLYEDASSIKQPDYDAIRGHFLLHDSAGNTIATLTPEYRTYHIRKTVTSPVSIHTTFWHDLYTVIGEQSIDGTRIAVRIYYNPMICLIWAGFMLMALGGLIAILRNKVNYYGNSAL